MNTPDPLADYSTDLPVSYDDTGYDDTHQIYNEMCDWLREQTLKLTADLGNGQKMIEAFLDIVERLRLTVNPSRDTLDTTSQARYILTKLVMAHEDEDGFPDKFRRVHTD